MTTGRTPSIVLEHVSKWYGDVVAVSDVSFGVTPGVTGLLGPNGAGKSTLLKLMAGLLAPSTGAVRIFGRPARGRPAAYRRLGLVPEQEQLYPHLTGREFVRLNAILQKLTDPNAAADRAIALVDMADAADRRLGGYSKGMRQRIKVAQAIVHDPPIFVLDEPLNGLDPAQRRRIVELIRRLGAEGRTILVSSHVLVEVERMAPRVVVLVNGRLVAEGETLAIRALLEERPRTLRVEVADRVAELAQALIGARLAQAVRLDDGTLVAETDDLETLGRRLPVLAQAQGVTLRRVEPLGDDLESVYAYLTARARGRGR